MARSSRHRSRRRKNSARALVVAAACFFTFADRASAETYPLECRKIDATWRDEPLWLCKRDWEDRLDAEERETFTVIATSSLLIGGRIRRR